MIAQMFYLGQASFRGLRPARTVCWHRRYVTVIVARIIRVGPIIYDYLRGQSQAE